MGRMGKRILFEGRWKQEYPGAEGREEGADGREEGADGQGEIATPTPVEGRGNE